jgi:pyridoxal phosphate enzyme (YggS family)
LAEVDKQAEKAGRIIPCLLQIHIAQEETKFGFTPDECMAMMDDGMWRNLTHVQIAGLMGMATYTDDHEQIIREFSTLSSLFQKLKETHFKDEPAFCELSMGMSGDYPLAISQGSTLIRIGSRIFGARQY